MTTRPAWLRPEVPDATWERIYLKHIHSMPMDLITDLIERGWLIPQAEHDRLIERQVRGAVVMVEGRAKKAEEQMREMREAIPEATRQVYRRFEAARALLNRNRKTVPMDALRAALGEDGES